MGLKNIATVWGRAEELASDKNLISHFDYIVARAVAPLKDLIKWSIPFLRPRDPDEGPVDPRLVRPPALVALKGGDLEDELSKASRVGGVRFVDVVNLVFPGSEEISAADKKIVVVRF